MYIQYLHGGLCGKKHKNVSVCVCVYSYVNVCARVGILCACILCVCVCVGVWSLRVDRYCTAQSRKSQETALPKLKKDIPAAQLFVTSHLKESAGKEIMHELHAAVAAGA